MFLAFIIDCFSRMVVGWQLAAHMRTTLVLDAPLMALGLREPGADVARCTTPIAAVRADSIGPRNAAQWHGDRRSRRPKTAKLAAGAAACVRAAAPVRRRVTAGRGRGGRSGWFTMLLPLPPITGHDEPKSAFPSPRCP